MNELFNLFFSLFAKLGLGGCIKKFFCPKHEKWTYTSVYEVSHTYKLKLIKNFQNKVKQKQKLLKNLILYYYPHLVTL